MQAPGAGNRAVAAMIDKCLDELAEVWAARHPADPLLRRGAAVELPDSELIRAYRRGWPRPVLRVRAGALRGEPGWLAVSPTV